MKSIRSQDLYTDADELLLLANNELSRASDDAVTHLVCRNSRQSIINYLLGYLLHNKIKPIKPVTLSGLLEQCTVIDSRFRKLDITPIQCRYQIHDKDYCLDMGTVEECFHVAREAKRLVKA